jgi:hypothetical protein
MPSVTQRGATALHAPPVPLLTLLLGLSLLLPHPRPRPPAAGRAPRGVSELYCAARPPPPASQIPGPGAQSTPHPSGIVFFLYVFCYYFSEVFYLALCRLSWSSGVSVLLPGWLFGSRLLMSFLHLGSRVG